MAITFMQTSQVYGQCLDFAAGPFTNFGMAPCDDGTGCPINALPFEAFASEAYIVTDFVAGAGYAFNICGGAGAGAWVPDFTIIAPSGAVDAFGAGDGDGCTISWTASESGSYQILINEMGECGGGPNVGTDGGVPSLTCTDGVACAPVVTICDAGTLVTTDSVDVCDVTDTFLFDVENDTIPTGGLYGFSVNPLDGATGGTGAGVTISGITIPDNWNSDLNGILAANNLPRLSGSWSFRGVVINAAGAVCDATVDSLIVTFGPTGASCDPSLSICNAGELTTTGVVSICEAAGTFDFNVINDTIPVGGAFGFTVIPLAGASGGVATGFTINGAATMASYDSDLGGILSANNVDPLSGGWTFRGFTLDGAGALCGVTTDSLNVFFGTESPTITEITNNGLDELTVNATGGVAPYSFLWDDPAAQTTMTATGLESGVVYTVTVIDANGCVVSGESSFSVSTNTISSLNDYSISPNPSNGSFIVDLNFEENSLIEIGIIDIAGKVVHTASKQANSATFNFNLQDESAGMYFINITVGQESMTKKIVISK